MRKRFVAMRFEQREETRVYAATRVIVLNTTWQGAVNANANAALD
jgi:hypothetical protein